MDSIEKLTPAKRPCLSMCNAFLFFVSTVNSNTVCRVW